jgi:hypothetical protein
MRVLLVIWFVGCTGMVAIAPKPGQTREPLGAALVIPGEAMEYRVHLRGFAIGLVQVAVGRAGWIAGREAIILRSHGTSSGLAALFSELTYELKTTLDVARGLPIENVEESTLVFGGETERERDEDTWSADDRHHDLHSIATAMRGWRSRPGVRASFETRIGGARIEAEIWEAGREYLPAVRTRAVRYDGIALEKYRFAVWISDDALRVPVALEAETRWGTVAVKLVEYEPARD